MDDKLPVLFREFDKLNPASPVAGILPRSSCSIRAERPRSIPKNSLCYGIFSIKISTNQSRYSFEIRHYFVHRRHRRRQYGVVRQNILRQYVHSVLLK